MSDNGPIFMPGDAVYYVGDKFKQELYTKEGKPLKGWIHSRVRNEPTNFVVEFPEAKEPDYIMSVKVLTKWRPAKMDKHEGPEVQPRRKRAAPEEE